MQPLIKAVIFDLDGVIIDSNPAIESFWKTWTDKENILLTNDLVCEWIYGRKVGDTIHGLFRHLDDTRKEEIRTTAHAFDSTMQPAAIAGVVSFIHALNRLRVPTGVVTSSHDDRMRKMLQHIGIDTAFTYFVTAQDVTNGKPYPEPYDKMRIQMQVPSDQCLVFEDAISGILSARAAGMHAIGIGSKATAPGLFASGACDVIEDFTFMTVGTSKLTAAGRTDFSI